MKDLFYKYGIKVISTTPKLYKDREIEIQQWLDTTQLNIEKFIILSDYFCMPLEVILKNDLEVAIHIFN